jgi:DNA polymerase-3 subunit chi
MAAPCQVDFYVLQDGAQSADRLACRLALMAWEQGHTALLVAADETEAEHLDALLWETPPGRFVPHGRAGLEGPEPVTIGTRADLAPGCADVIINLSPEPVPDPAQYRRLLEFVPASAAERDRSRAKFRHYRDLGLDPASHPLARG